MGLDTMGNMFARREGTDPDALPVYVGCTSTPSRRAANTTACWACSAGWRLIRTLNDLGIKTKHPIVVTNWTNEEGTRFAPAMLSSGVFAGVHDAGLGLCARGCRGQELRRRAGPHRLAGEEEVGARKMHAFFELHIEQGPILEAEGKDIGVVTHGQGLWLDCRSR